jgi:hypothetical protein
MRLHKGTLLVMVCGLALAAHRAEAMFHSAPAAVAQPPLAVVRPTPADTALVIDWATAGKETRGDAAIKGARLNARFIAANRGEIDKITIPVLLPGEPDLADNLRIFANGVHYTATSRSRDMSFVLTGHGRAFSVSREAGRALPGGDLKVRIPHDGLVIQGGEGGVDASFNRYGASYSISLECAKPETDMRCNGDAYIRSVISRLMVVLPAGGGR